MSVDLPNRRSFIISATAVAGGLLVACKTTASKTKGLDDLIDIAAVLKPTAFVQVTKDGTVICILARVEMGQGTATSHAGMVAEEMGLDPQSVEIQFAPPGLAYINPNFGVQITGSTTSTATSWRPLRLAAAATRDMLILGGALQMRKLPTECRCEGGRIIHSSGQSVSFGDIAQFTADNIPPVLAPQLKASGDYKILGKAGPRVDERAKIQGSAGFGIDVQMDGLRMAAVKRPAQHGASVVSFDATAAKAYLQPLDPNAVIMQISSGVAVVTTSNWLAMKAADKLVLTLKDGTAGGFDGSMATRAAATGISATSTAAASAIERGNVQSALAPEAKPLTAIYETQFLPHVTLEPQNCTASYTGDHLELWVPSQMPSAALAIASHISGLSPDAIKVHGTYIGGGFGRRINQDYVADAVELSKALQAPVKVVWSREEDTMHDFYRPGAVHFLSGAVSGQQLSGWSHRVVSPSVAQGLTPDFIAALTPGVPGSEGLSNLVSSSFQSGLKSRLVVDPFAVEGAKDIPYSIPNLKVDWVYDDPGVPVGFWRSVGHGGNAFAVESFVDELAASAALDPLAMRQAMLQESPRDLAVLNQVANMAGWGTPVAPIAGGQRARGIALHSCFSSYCAQVVQVVFKDDKLFIEKVWCAVDCGFVLNPEIVKQQVEGGIIFALTAATKQKITFKDGATVQAGMNTLGLLTQQQAPDIEVAIVNGTDPNVAPTGIGEVSAPALAPALCAAIARATGVRYRSLPLPLQLGVGRLAVS